MRFSRMTRMLGVAAVLCLGAMFQSEAEAGKKNRQEPAPGPRFEAPPPAPAPMTILPPAGHSDHVAAYPEIPSCEHKCCKRRERRCKHSCETVFCPPTVEYKGCPAPCSITRVVTVTHTKSCVTIEVPIQVPDHCREEVDRDRDGDLELEYGKYEVSLRWRDGGRRLVVHYDD